MNMNKRTSIDLVLISRAVMLTAFLMSAAATSAKADLIIDPLTATGPTGDYTPTQLIDNSTLTSNLASPGTTETVPATFPDAVEPANSNSGEYRINATSLTAPIVFNLNLDPGTGGNLTGYDISGLYVYNYEEDYDDVYYNGRGVETATLRYSTDGGATYQTYGTLTFSEAPDSASDPGQMITLDSTLGGVTGVTNLELVGGSNYGDGSYTGLSEVRFIGTTATPEPSTYGMVFVGLGALAALVSRRRRSGEQLL